MQSNIGMWRLLINRYFHPTDMDDEVVNLLLHRNIANMLVQLAHKLYRKYVQVVKGRHVLYVKPKKLFGSLCAAYHFWKRL